MKEIKGSSYKISLSGEVFSGKTGKKMKTNISNCGYETLVLSIDGVYKRKYIHRLLAETYIDNPDNLPCVNHIDCNKLNNILENLEWCTYKENYNHFLENTDKEARDANFKYKMRNGHNKRAWPCLIDGIFYHSLRQAASALGYIDHRYIKAAIEDGKHTFERLSLD